MTNNPLIDFLGGLDQHSNGLMNFFHSLSGRSGTSPTNGDGQPVTNAQSTPWGDLWNNLSMGAVAPSSAPQPPAQRTNTARDIFNNTLLQAGLPQHVVDGIGMNIGDESSFNPSAVNPTSGAFGLGQWLGPRKTALMNYAQAHGVSPSDPQLQANFLLQELQGPEAGTMKALSGTQNASDAAVTFLKGYERPGEADIARRAAAYGSPNYHQQAFYGDNSGSNVSDYRLPDASARPALASFLQESGGPQLTNGADLSPGLAAFRASDPAVAPTLADFRTNPNKVNYIHPGRGASIPISNSVLPYLVKAGFNPGPQSTVPNTGGGALTNLIKAGLTMAPGSTPAAAPAATTAQAAAVPVMPTMPNLPDTTATVANAQSSIPQADAGIAGYMAKVMGLVPMGGTIQGANTTGSTVGASAGTEATKGSTVTSGTSRQGETGQTTTTSGYKDLPPFNPSDYQYTPEEQKQMMYGSMLGVLSKGLGQMSHGHDVDVSDVLNNYQKRRMDMFNRAMAMTQERRAEAARTDVTNTDNTSYGMTGSATDTTGSSASTLANAGMSSQNANGVDVSLGRLLPVTLPQPTFKPTVQQVPATGSDGVVLSKDANGNPATVPVASQQLIPNPSNPPQLADNNGVYHTILGVNMFGPAARDFSNVGDNLTKIYMNQQFPYISKGIAYANSVKSDITQALAVHDKDGKLLSDGILDLIPSGGEGDPVKAAAQYEQINNMLVSRRKQIDDQAALLGPNPDPAIRNTLTQNALALNAAIDRVAGMRSVLSQDSGQGDNVPANDIAAFNKWKAAGSPRP